jgi:hypothetical protein
MSVPIKINRHSIGDRVYHITPESPEGFVIDAKYSFLTNQWEYLVTFSPLQESLWYSEIELVEYRTFNSGT